MRLHPFVCLAVTIVALSTSGIAAESSREEFGGQTLRAPAARVEGGICRGRPANAAGPWRDSGALQITSAPSGISARRTGLQGGGGACCLPAGACADVSDAAECSGLGGYFFAADSCSDDPCGVGACCSDESCSLADAYACLSGGREFAGAGTDCLTDPCGGGIGACCAEAGCFETGLERCDAEGGSWLGAGTQCADEPCAIGSCCRPGACDPVPRFECEREGGVFEPGGQCEPESCSVENDCAADSLYTQTRDLPEAFTAYTSERSAGFERWENYEGTPGAIRDITWWGLDLEFTQGGFIECSDPSGLFSVSLRENLAGRPGAPVCSFQGVVEQEATGILYAGAELNEYRIRLPEACILPQGWLSIVGGGDPDCWFLWLGSPVGDDRSLCDGCESRVTGDDLSFCLGGEGRGISGSCCDASTGLCEDGVDIADCVGVGQTFGADQLCADLDPPCAQRSGACCLGELGCDPRLPVDCEELGGQWLGADAPCRFCPKVGACCSGDESCSIETKAGCRDQSANWLGPNTVCEDCPKVPVCGPRSLFSQSPDGPGDFIAGTSEAGTPFARSEDFFRVAGATRAVRWWGVDLDNIEGTDDFIECVEDDPTFDLIVSRDAGGVPGEAICTSSVLAKRKPLGLYYLGTELNEYRARLPEPCAAVEGWLSIIGRGDPECWFLWMSAGLGDSHCDGCIPDAQDFDLALCLGGTPGGVPGACCDDAVAACGDGVDISQCTDPELRFEAGAACSDLEPPCGTVLGACCRPDASCGPRTREQCKAGGGDWQGPDTLCDSCPCTIPCPSGSREEGEPPCRDGYIDTFNGGCDSAPPVFSTLAVGDTVCGTSGLFLDGFDVRPDSDWYEVEVDRAGILAWSAQAEFVSTLAILAAGDGCPGTLLAVGNAPECGSTEVTASVEPGTYWLLIEPAVFADSAACPAPYTATVELR